MGSIRPNSFDDGFRVFYDNGTSEEFLPNNFDEGYHGDKGSVIREHVLDSGFIVEKYDGTREHFRESFWNDSIIGDKGTEIRKGLLGDVIVDTSNTRNKSKGGDVSVPNFSGGWVTIGFVVAVVACLCFSVKHAPEQLGKAFSTVDAEFLLITVPWMAQFVLAAIMTKVKFINNRVGTYISVLKTVVGAGLILFVISVCFKRYNNGLNH